MNASNKGSPWRILAAICGTFTLVLVLIAAIPWLRGMRVNRALAELRAAKVYCDGSSLRPGIMPWVNSLLSQGAPASIELIKADRLGPEEIKLLAMLPEMRALEIDFITDDDLEELARIPALRKARRLIFQRAPITDEGAAELTKFENLESVGLEQAQITDDALRHISHATGLKYLWLPWNQFTDAGFEHLKDVRGLELIRFRERSLSPSIAAWLAQQEQLESLVVSEIEFSSEQLRLISSLGRPKELSLRGTISGDLAALKTMTQLIRLNLSKSKLSDDQVAGLVEMPGLMKLHLSDTQLTDASLEHIERIPKLRYVELTGPEITPEGVSRLKEARPELNVEYHSEPMK